MEGREKSRMDKYGEITNDWNYGASCPLTSLSFCDLENFKHLVFVVQCTNIISIYILGIAERKQ
jgi:hypothetical protein